MLQLEEIKQAIEVIDKLAVRVTDPNGTQLCQAASMVKGFLSGLAEQLDTDEERPDG